MGRCLVPCAPRAEPFLGRAAELEAISLRFAEGARIVTLTGRGGIGKTALAVEHAERRGRDAFFVDATGASDGASLANVTAGVVGALADHGEVLVVIDPFDHLSPCAREAVVSWTQSFTQASFLVTSATPLEVAGEAIVEIGPLDAAPGLLVAAARREAGAFVVRPEDASYIVEIAKLTDGVPRTLVRAGADLPVYGVRGVYDRLRGTD